MLRQPIQAATKRGARRLHASSGRAARSSRTRVLTGGAAVLALASAGALGAHFVQPSTLHGDASTSSSFHNAEAVSSSDKPRVEDDGKLRALSWGSNKSSVISSDAPGYEQIRTPEAVAFLEGVALRDVALHAHHAACVDVRGDVYQWGDRFFGDSPTGKSDRKPVRTLQGKNIQSLQVTASRVFALSASGRVYVLSTRKNKQGLPSGMPTPASAPWWGTGWMRGEEPAIDFAEIVPAQPLSWGEKVTSIAAGTDHLLALTSSGRTFAHPITKKANTHGQLGFRKFDVADPSSSTRMNVELTPVAVVDPYARASRFSRAPSGSSSRELREVSENLVNVDDSDIRFSSKLFEVPALRNVKVVEIAAGGRSSFVRTDAGRVLGWGANDYGQIGLGGNVTLDTITVPTEVVLWRSTPSGMGTRCIGLHAGGNLTFFTVERRDGTSLSSVELLACGNGQFGGLGNAMFTNAQGVPVRTKAVSGLLEYSEKTNNLQPIVPQTMSVSPDGHVLLTLDTRAQAGPGGGGRDLIAWGTNYEYQLGNGRRTSVAVPVTMERGGERFMLERRKAREVRDLEGKVWARGVEVEQVAVAGYGNSMVYWRVC
ncbi:RCC1/BLIP-II [Amylostereum chailletii]|nr:RCC1/BLIP-II [Amylostereum chailletii]